MCGGGGGGWGVVVVDRYVLGGWCWDGGDRYARYLEG